MAHELLNFEGELNVALFDQVVGSMYQGDPKLIMEAQKILSDFKDHPDAWKRSAPILEKSQNSQSKFIGLQVLESMIKYRWNLASAEQKNGIKAFVVDFIIQLSSSFESLQREKVILGKANLVLVQILKHEWPKNWESFIPDLISSSHGSEAICENNMAILKIFSEEIFDFSQGEMTSQKTKKMKSDWVAEFSKVFELCVTILSQSQTMSLLYGTLQTLHRFLTWIPLGYIFETSIIDLLIQKFFPFAFFRNVSLKCLTEIGSLKNQELPPELFVKFFVMFSEQLRQVLKVETDIASAYESGTNEDRDFILNLALFLTSFLQTHLSEVEGTQQVLTLEVHHYLASITLVNNAEVFKVCLEYWNKLADSLYHEPPSENFPQSALMLGDASRGHTQSPRGQFYASIMSKVRIAVVSRMRKPKEILIVEDENGELVRESLPDTASIEMYKQMRETLIFLTHLDPEDMQQIMLEKLKKQCSGDWTWKGLNTLCWAIGSISGSLLEEDEKNFVVTVIRELLTLCEKIRGKDNKAVIASNIMYIVGQYPRFLLAHWKFLKTVVNKLFEFMHETFPGVQDMACDTFLKISKQCREKFVIVHQGEVVGFIEEILSNLSMIIRNLENQQIHTFYESVGYMISSAPSQQQRENLIERLMELPNIKWDQTLSMASDNIDYLCQYENAKSLLNILKINVRVAQALGFGYLPQLRRIFLHNLQLYRAYSQRISDQVRMRGVQATHVKEIRAMRAVKRETLRLIETFVSKANDVEMVASHFVPPLLDAILVDYKTNIAEARDSEVLSVMACIVNKLRGLITPQIPPVFDNVFECTLQMITNNFEDFPDHRIKFFKLLRSINSQCFPAFLGMSEESFSLIIESIFWAFKHTIKDVSEMGLLIMLELWKNVSNSNSDFAGMFVRRFYLKILTEILLVLTDRMHKSGFKLHSQILQAMITVVESGQVQVPLFDPAAQPQGMTNQMYLRQYLSNLLTSGFPNLTSVQVEKFIVGLCDLSKDQNAFKNHIRDFLVQLKEFASEEDLELLFAEEREQEIKEKKAAIQLKHSAIPGMIAMNSMEEES